MSKNHSSIKVIVNENTPVEKALRKFKRLCEAYGIIREYKNREQYTKPSVKSKEKREQAAKRRKKTSPRRQKI